MYLQVAAPYCPADSSRRIYGVALHPAAIDQVVILVGAAERAAQTGQSPIIWASARPLSESSSTRPGHDSTALVLHGSKNDRETGARALSDITNRPTTFNSLTVRIQWHPRPSLVRPQSMLCRRTHALAIPQPCPHQVDHLPT